MTGAYRMVPRKPGHWLPRVKKGAKYFTR